MYATSQAFQDAIAGTHQMLVAATVGPWGGTETDITAHIVGGSVSVDRRRAVRRTCTIEIADVSGDLVPTSATDLLHTASANVIKLYRGLRWPAGEEPSAAWWSNPSQWFSPNLWLPNGGTLNPETTELVPLGCFRIVNTSLTETGAGIQITLEGADFSWAVAKSLWVEPFAITSGTLVSEALEAILDDRAPTFSHGLTDSEFELPTLAWGLGSEGTTDPWQVCQTLADDAGYEIFYDVSGVARMRPTPDSGVDTADLTYAAGATEVLLQASRDLDGDQLYNGVVVTAEGSQLANPIRVERWDENASSPTRAGGPLGFIPEIYSSSQILTVEQAEAAADERLRRHLGVGASLSWSQIVNPALDSNDVIAVTRPDLGVADMYVVDSLTVPLSAREPMTAMGRTLTAAEGT